MANKNKQQQDIGRLLSEGKARRGGYTDQSLIDAHADQGTWITSQEQLDELAKSVDNFEKFLRS